MSKLTDELKATVEDDKARVIARMKQVICASMNALKRFEVDEAPMSEYPDILSNWILAADVHGLSDWVSLTRELCSSVLLMDGYVEGKDS